MFRSTVWFILSICSIATVQGQSEVLNYKTAAIIGGGAVGCTLLCAILAYICARRRQEKKSKELYKPNVMTAVAQATMAYESPIQSPIQGIQGAQIGTFEGMNTGLASEPGPTHATGTNEPQTSPLTVTGPSSGKIPASNVNFTPATQLGLPYASFQPTCNPHLTQTQPISQPQSVQGLNASPITVLRPGMAPPPIPRKPLSKASPNLAQTLPRVSPEGVAPPAIQPSFGLPATSGQIRPSIIPSSTVPNVAGPLSSNTERAMPAMVDNAGEVASGPPPSIARRTSMATPAVADNPGQVASGPPPSVIRRTSMAMPSVAEVGTPQTQAPQQNRRISVAMPPTLREDSDPVPQPAFQSDTPKVTPRGPLPSTGVAQRATMVLNPTAAPLSYLAEEPAAAALGQRPSVQPPSVQKEDQPSTPITKRRPSFQPTPFSAIQTAFERRAEPVTAGHGMVVPPLKENNQEIEPPASSSARRASFQPTPFSHAIAMEARKRAANQTRPDMVEEYWETGDT